jgi:endonuclease YncB( thermonuclease family)
MEGWPARVSMYFLGGLLFGGPAAACDLPPGETATVASVVDGETLKLTDGREVRLLGVKAPAPPLGWKGEGPWPFVAESKAALDRLASGATVELRFDTRREDRHGHVLAQVFLEREGRHVWLQEDLVARGFARVYSLADTRACIAELLAAERQARDGRLGLWRSWAYRVQDADPPKRLGRLTHSYQLVEGTVHAIGEGRKLLYVNFAPDWRSDFTVTIELKNLARFEAAGLDLQTLPGKRIRVRGFMEWWNGPMIAATHPEQIEVLPPASPAG